MSKHLLPIYDKPMIYYPLSVLMLAGIREILIISTPLHIPSYRRLLGTGEQLGISIEYRVQPAPKGIPQAFLIGQDFIGREPVALILGDNFFYGPGLRSLIRRAITRLSGATIFAYPATNLEALAVVELDEDSRPIDLEEKPETPKSPHAVTGLYLYEPEVVEISRNLRPSSREELEITDVNREFLRQDRLVVELLSEEIVWLDAGSPDSLLEAANLVSALERGQDRKVACVEEIAWRMGFISSEDLLRLTSAMQHAYGQYLRSLVEA